MARILIYIILGLASLAAQANELRLHGLPYRFVSDRGETVSLERWQGRPAILTMEYANCRFLCSITLLKLREVQAEADRRKQEIDFLVVSIDPANDTPEAWTQYRRKRDLTRPNWHFLTASEADTAAFAGLLGIKYWFYGEHLMHDFRILRLDGTGRVLKIMEAYDAEPAELLD
jgi:protein SCO1/2